jgi:glyoxylase-like metal-dependent hydrolase (beta-lactamase superfamily II)
MMKPVATDWYEVRHLADGISHIRESYVGDWLRCNIWHVRGRDRDILIDSGMGMRSLKHDIAALAERPVTAISSHAHFDHIGGAHEFAERLGHKAEAHIHADPTWAHTAANRQWIRAETISALPHEGYDIDSFAIVPAPLTGYLDEGDVVDLGDRVFQVFHLPGHSPGSIALYEEKTGIMLSGDVVYDGDLFDTVYHSEPEVYHRSLRRLREMPVNVVHAGHGGSFDRERLKLIIDEYFAGGRRIDNLEEWLARNMG